jgi:hypothetical protein
MPIPRAGGTVKWFSAWWSHLVKFTLERHRDGLRAVDVHAA